MDAPLRRPTGLPPGPGSQPAAPAPLSPSGSSKPLAFSIERIMARPEPRPLALPGWLQPPAGVVPLLPLGYEPQRLLLDSGPELLGLGLGYRNPEPDQSGAQTQGHYKLFRPRVVTQGSFPAMGTVYLNCGDSGACPPPAGLVNLHVPMASYLLSARHKALLADKAPAERFSAAQSHGHIQHYVKEREHILADNMFKGSAAASRLSSSCAGNKPKVFTCEVCGKVSPALVLLNCIYCHIIIETVYTY